MIEVEVGGNRERRGGGGKRPGGKRRKEDEEGGVNVHKRNKKYHRVCVSISINQITY